MTRALTSQCLGCNATFHSFRFCRAGWRCAWFCMRASKKDGGLLACLLFKALTVSAARKDLRRGRGRKVV